MFLSNMADPGDFCRDSYIISSAVVYSVLIWARFIDLQTHQYPLNFLQRRPRWVHLESKHWLPVLVQSTNIITITITSLEIV